MQVIKDDPSSDAVAAVVVSNPIVSKPASRRDVRTSSLPVCTVCASSMVAAESSAYVSEDVVSYLWSCDNCGYGFVTKHLFKPVCN